MKNNHTEKNEDYVLFHAQTDAVNVYSNVKLLLMI